MGHIQHLTGPWFSRHKNENYKPRPLYEEKKRSEGVFTWLTIISQCEDTYIQSAFNVGERKIQIKGRLVAVDGYSDKKKKVYEFLGCKYTKK